MTPKKDEHRLAEAWIYRRIESKQLSRKELLGWVRRIRSDLEKALRENIDVEQVSTDK